MLLPQLPEQHDYLVLFMDRPIPEVVASQFKMISRNGEPGENGSSATDNPERSRQMASELHRHRSNVRQWLYNSGHFRVYAVSYPDLLRDPESRIQQIVEFVGEQRLPTAHKMKEVIRTDLYRNRKTIADRY